MAAEGQRATESAELGALIAAADGHVRAGRLAEAAAAYRRILALRPRSAAAHNDLGSLLARQGQLDEAAACFAAALALKPDDSAALNNLGIVLARQDRLDEAQLHFERALALRPDDFDALNNVACLLLRRQRFAEAEARLRQLLALRPDAPQTHNNLGTALGQQGKFDQALMHFERAIALLPGHAEAYHNIGNLLLRHGRLAGVAERCQQAIARHADHIDAHLNLATLHLVQGDHERGWPLYEWRLRAPDATQPRLPRWQGQPLAGRRLLLFAEQGLGDTILFVRFARAFQERGAHVVLAAPKPLAALFHGVAGIDEFYALGSTDQLPQCDFYLPLLSAPFALGTTADTIPRDVPYLAADPVLIDRWRPELSAIEGLKIGIAWQGARGYRFDRFRSIPLAEFAPLARVPGVRLISLQKGEGSEQVAQVDFPLVDFSERLDRTSAFMDTAAVIANLDLVVAPNSAVAHLAGALGARTWLALPLSADWRWLQLRNDSPWYPTLRIFRQAKLGQWGDVFERMAAAIEASRSAGGFSLSAGVKP